MRGWENPPGGHPALQVTEADGASASYLFGRKYLVCEERSSVTPQKDGLILCT